MSDDDTTPNPGTSAGTIAAIAAAVIVAAAGVSIGTGIISSSADGGTVVSADAGIRVAVASMSAPQQASLAYSVYAVTDVDGGLAPLAMLSDGGQVLLDSFPCRRRIAGTDAGTCNLLLPDGGERDFGELNTLQPGTFADHGGCEPTACVGIFR